MYISRLAFVLAALSAASCIDKDVDNTEFYEGDFYKLNP